MFLELRSLILPTFWHYSFVVFGTDLTNLWMTVRLNRATLLGILRYAAYVLVPYFQFSSVFGFALLINMITQMWSGILLALYYIPDPSLVMTLREEYMNEIW